MDAYPDDKTQGDNDGGDDDTEQLGDQVHRVKSILRMLEIGRFARWRRANGL